MTYDNYICVSIFLHKNQTLVSIVSRPRSIKWETPEYIFKESRTLEGIEVSWEEWIGVTNSTKGNHFQVTLQI